MGKYVWPCPSYSRISSGYGNRTCPFHGKEFHDGVDLAAASGALQSLHLVPVRSRNPVGTAVTATISASTTAAA